MDGIHFSFVTTAFHDDDDARAERVNETVGGHALAVWLAGRLKAAGRAVSDPWGEDHGYAFDIRDGGRVYLCTCSIEDDEATEREAHVLVTLHRSLWDRLSGRNALGVDDALAGAVETLLASSSEIAKLSRD